MQTIVAVIVFFALVFFVSGALRFLLWTVEAGWHVADSLVYPL